MLKPLGVAYIVSLFMSLIVAMTVTPLLSKWLLSPARHLERRQSEGRVERTLGSVYRRSLEWTLRHPMVVKDGTALLLGVVLIVCFSLGSSFLPEFNEGAATISAAARPGVSLDVSNELGNAMERELLQIPEVVATARRTGRGELDEHSQATNSAEIDVRFNFGDRSRDEVFDEIRHRLGQVPGVVITIGQPLGHRIDHMISGTRANIAVKISGDDLAQLRRLGEQIAEVMRGVDGVVDVSVEQQTMTPQLQIRADREALARHGITIADFNRFVEVAFGANPVGTIYEGQRSYDVVVRMEGFSGHNADEVRNTMIDTGDGGRVALAEVAEIIPATGPNTISRENVQRKLVVSANVSGRDLGSAVNEMQKAVADGIELPEGYRIEYGGQFENARSASRTLFIATLLAVALIFLLLLGEFKSPALALIVLVTLPFALIGGVLAVWITTAVVSIPAIIGFITLFGVATRNGILLVSRYRHLRSEGQDIDSTVIKGSADRLNPILMTALTSALALIPLVIAADKPGNEIQSPMAVVVLGGLLTSTLLNLYLMPLIYRWYEQRRVLRESQQQAQNVSNKI
ncbi:MAG: efflux RND transporter permease subunit, partial [Muribaculaceae bacterium]|nr:efflux RND transporter permease subunit [Muribaculaceae bacterium]